MTLPNRAGEYSFHPKIDKLSDTYDPDITRPNPAYFALLDGLIPFAAKLGITIMLVPTWGRYINGGYYGSPILFTSPTLAYDYGHFVGKRYPFHPFVLGGDSNRFWNTGTMAHLKSGKGPCGIEAVDLGPIYEAMGEGLRHGEMEAIRMMKEELGGKEEGYKTFITFHSAQFWSSHSSPLSTYSSTTLPLRFSSHRTSSCHPLFATLLFYISSSDCYFHCQTNPNYHRGQSL